jgi:hypothetical protein
MFTLGEGKKWGNAMREEKCNKDKRRKETT